MEEIFRRSLRSCFIENRTLGAWGWSIHMTREQRTARWTVHSPLIFRSIIGIEHLPLRTAIVVWNVPSLAWANPNACTLGNRGTKMAARDGLVNSSCAQPSHPPPSYCGAFARLFSPAGGAFANFALPGSRAFANPGGIPELLTLTRFPR